MYIPNINTFSDQEEIIKFIKKFGFGMIVSQQDNCPVATHLPFILTEQNGEITLYSHFAKANPQWKNIENQKILIVFTEPHAYISPIHYEKMNVPTWNYIAVHIYGSVSILYDEKEIMKVLDDTTAYYEKQYAIEESYDVLSQEYKEKLAKATVAFKINVEEIQGKKKLSQNKNQNEQLNIINTLENSSNSSEKLIADYMKDELSKKCSLH